MDQGMKEGLLTRGLVKGVIGELLEQTDDVKEGLLKGAVGEGRGTNGVTGKRLKGAWVGEEDITGGKYKLTSMHAPFTKNPSTRGQGLPIHTLNK